MGTLAGASWHVALQSKAETWHWPLQESCALQYFQVHSASGTTGMSPCGSLHCGCSNTSGSRALQEPSAADPELCLQEMSHWVLAHCMLPAMLLPSMHCFTRTCSSLHSHPDQACSQLRGSCRTDTAAQLCACVRLQQPPFHLQARPAPCDIRSGRLSRAEELSTCMPTSPCPPDLAACLPSSLDSHPGG